MKPVEGYGPPCIIFGRAEICWTISHKCKSQKLQQERIVSLLHGMLALSSNTHAVDVLLLQSFVYMYQPSHILY